MGARDYVNLTEFSVDFVEPDEHVIFNPAHARSLRTNDCASSIALRRIHRGEEIFNNYMTFENSENLDEYAESLRNECAGLQVGQVSEYELTAQGKQTQLNSSEACQDCKKPLQEIM